MHVLRSDDIRDDVSFIVMQAVLLLHQTGFHRITDGRVRNGFQFDPAPLAGHQDHRVTDVVGAYRPIADLRNGQRGGKPGG